MLSVIQINIAQVYTGTLREYGFNIDAINVCTFLRFAACTSVQTSNKCSLVFKPSHVFFTSFRGVWRWWLQRNVLNERHVSSGPAWFIIHTVGWVLQWGWEFNERYYSKHSSFRVGNLVHLAFSVIGFCEGCRPPCLNAVSLSRCVNRTCSKIQMWNEMSLNVARNLFVNTQFCEWQPVMTGYGVAVVRDVVKCFVNISYSLSDTLLYPVGKLLQGINFITSLTLSC